MELIFFSLIKTLASTDDIVRSDVKVDDVQIETADIVSKFKFFETFKPEQKEKKAFRITPPRDGVAKVSRNAICSRFCQLNFEISNDSYHRRSLIVSPTS